MRLVVCPMVQHCVTSLTLSHNKDITLVIDSQNENIEKTKNLISKIIDTLITIFVVGNSRVYY